MIVRRIRISQWRYLVPDALILALADIAGLLIRFDMAVPQDAATSTLYAMVFTIPLRVLIHAAFGMYQRRWQ